MFKFVSTKNINELFQRAILHNDIQRTKLILAEAMKVPRFNIDQINEEGLTALQFSCFAGNVEIVKILASYGANWKIRDRDGYTLLHAAAMSGSGAVLRYLLQLGLKPALKTDEGLMPIDLTDEISIVVILLRAMLDQGYLQEMQDYMIDHPKLKRNIFKELEKVKCLEQEKAQILNEMPYTSHTPERSPGNTLEKPTKKKQQEGYRRSTSTFSELSDSIQQLDRLDSADQVDVNNNIFTGDERFENDDSGSTLKRESSFSSASSCSGREHQAIHYDSENAYRDTQQYLENRFPPVSNASRTRPKSITFSVTDTDNNCKEKKRRHSENRSIIYEEQNVNSSSASPYEPLYENTSSARRRAQISLTEDPNKIYSRTILKQAPPPLPPRAPTTKLSDGLRLNHVSFNTTVDTVRGYEDYHVSNRKLGSETDSGIDINETTGRMFALSVNDRDPTKRFSYNADFHSRPLGLNNSEQFNRPLVKQHTHDDTEIPDNFAIARNPINESKYKSWSGRTYHEARMIQSVQECPTTDTRPTFYDTRDRCTTLPSGKSRVVTKKNVSSNDSYHTSSVHKVSEAIDFSLYDFDNQPEIML